MQIDMDHFRTKLKNLESELQEDINRNERNALEDSDADSPIPDVGDAIDQAVSGENKDAALNMGTRDFETLQMVREALARLDAGTFGICIICGREIALKRLEAIPWTPVCIDDAEKLEPDIPTPTL